MRSCAPEPLRAHGGTCARPTAGVHGRTCARSPGADSPKRPRAGHPLCHRRRVQVTVEPDALAEWSAHARRTGSSLHARLAALDGDLAPLAHTWHGAAADRFAARHRQWQDAVGGAARHADRARRPGRRRPRQLPGRHVGQHRDLAAAGLVDGGRRARDGGGRRPGQGPWTDRGGPRGHPDGGAGPRRRDGGSRRGVERAAHRARRIRPGWRAATTARPSPPTTTPWPRRPGRAGAAAC